MTTITMRDATPADAAALSRFARDTFVETFGPFNDPADMAAYERQAFSPAIQAAEITAPDSFTLLAVDAVGRIAGYVFASFAAPASVRVGEAPLEIKRFYVGSAWHGRGVAQQLMSAARERGRNGGARTVWLGVWERNARAIAFYERIGFQQVGTQQFVLGADVQTDIVMAMRC